MQIAVRLIDGQRPLNHLELMGILPDVFNKGELGFQIAFAVQICRFYITQLILL